MPNPPLPETTAIYENRRTAKARVEAQLQLLELGNETTKFFTTRGTVFAEGYVRVVYGDHGPYVEFDRKHIRCELRPKFAGPLKAHAFYEWLLPIDGSNLKVYDQKKTVSFLKNPPAGGFRGNRAEGYADYRVGMIYVSPFDFARIQ